jgi:hypothetical protein
MDTTQIGSEPCTTEVFLVGKVVSRRELARVNTPGTRYNGRNETPHLNLAHKSLNPRVRMPLVYASSPVNVPGVNPCFPGKLPPLKGTATTTLRADQ